MSTQMWLSAGWLLLLLMVSLGADKNSVQHSTATSAVAGQSARLTPVVSLDQHTQRRSQTKPGGRCEGAAPASPLSAQACRQETLVRQKQTTTLSQRSPRDLFLPLKGDRQHG